MPAGRGGVCVPCGKGAVVVTTRKPRTNANTLPGQKSLKGIWFHCYSLENSQCNVLRD